MRKVSIGRPAATGLVKGVVLPLAGCVAVAGAGFLLRDLILPENQVLLFLLFVVTATVKLGRMAGFVATFASVLLYDLFLVPPYFSLDVHDAQHFLTFALILVVSLITSHFVEGIRVQHRTAMEREEQANALREMSVALAGAVDMASVCSAGAEYMRRMFDGSTKVLVADGDGRVVQAGYAGTDAPAPFAMMRIVAALMAEGTSRQALSVSSAGAYYFALHAAGGVAGVLVLMTDGASGPLSPMAERLAQVAAQQLSMAIERVRLADVASASQLDVKAERFRNSLLNSISHDLRTPLAALNGLAGQLQAQGGGDVPMAIQRVAQRLDNMVGNLLELARFSHGRAHLRQDWHVIDEVIGSAIAQAREHGGKLRYFSSVQGAPSLVSFDAVLIERVLCNFLENAERHAVGATAVRVRAGRRKGRLVVMASDDGAGISSQAASALLAPGLRNDDTRPGLGLSICRAIVEAHGGAFSVARRRGGGTRAAFSIPLSEPPGVEIDE